MKTVAIRQAYDALLAVEPRSPAELLLSNGACLVNGALTLDHIITGLVEVELPGHTIQLR